MQACPCRAGGYACFIHYLFTVDIALAGASILGACGPVSTDLTPDQGLDLRLLLTPSFKLRIIFELRDICSLLIAQFERSLIEMPHRFIIALQLAAFGDALK